MLQFNRLTLHNFGSYSHAELDLHDKGFCLVTGENHYTKDNAKSNGSGKSFLWSGICFALTGETIQGIKSDLKNHFAADNDAYVTLDFNADKDHFVITRIIAPKSDLKISKNDTDVSGKGIRESEAKLEELLPDVNQMLIASTIIIGQGMPNKFSAFKPSGRKELLEKLTKSDFMIADIKKRIADRQTALSQKLREIQDKMLVLKTKITSTSNSLESAKASKSSAVKPDFDKSIKELEAQLLEIDARLAASKASVTEQEKLVESLNAKVVEETESKSAETTDMTNKFNARVNPIIAEKSELAGVNKGLMRDIAGLAAHPDICPTCGQKMPNSDHIKEEKAKKEAELSANKAKIAQLDEDYNAMIAKKNQYIVDINSRHDAGIATARLSLSTAKSALAVLKTAVQTDNSLYNATNEQLIKTKERAASWDREMTALDANIKKLSGELAILVSNEKETNDASAETQQHIAAVTKLDTLTKRDFRGYILTDIIRYLDAKAKEYAKIVFGHTDLNLYLDGNDLDISYDGKSFDNLSGGEKTRVDLIIQFAIRDLLTTYLNASSNILVLDEVTDFLDQTSCDAVMGLISDKLKDVESVFIISHHADELNLPIDCNMTVIKGEDGISTLLQK